MIRHSVLATCGHPTAVRKTHNGCGGSQGTVCYVLYSKNDKNIAPKPRE